MLNVTTRQYLKKRSSMNTVDFPVKSQVKVNVKRSKWQRLSETLAQMHWMWWV